MFASKDLSGKEYYSRFVGGLWGTPDVGEEIQVLERIYDKFKDFGFVEISDYSYKEKGYMYKEGRDYFLRIC